MVRGKLEKMEVEKIDIEALINKGAQVKEDIIKDQEEQKKNEEAKWTNINLRIPKEMVKSIDHIVERERIGISRTGWILEAIYEKMKGIRKDD